MACTTRSLFHCITLVLVFLATTSTKANSVSIRANVLGINVGGTARCSATVTGNNPTTSAPLANLNVTATLNGQPIASAITNRDGSFRINLNTLTNIEIEVGTNIIKGLKLMISLPIVECPIWANVTAGKLEANVTLPNLNIVGSIVDGVLNLPVNAMIHVV